MSKRNHPAHRERGLCDQLGPEDGIDPRYQRRLPEGRAIHRKTLQLCGQVKRTVAEVLASCGDDVLRDLEVVQVSPAAGGGRLLVTVQPAVSASTADPALIERHLCRAAGRVRTEVTALLHRRRAPELVFELLPQERSADGRPSF